jgi:hypothetical protein
MILYKYTAFNLLSIRTILLNEIYFAKYEQFNDPFDSFIQYNNKSKIGKLTSSIIRNNLGIFCLSKTNNSILMFSHYAKNHTGICFEFDTDEFGLNERPEKIIYQNNNIGLNNFIINNENELRANLKKSLLSKSVNWNYENEYRIIRIINRNSERIINITNEAIKGIILGCRMPKSNKILIKKLIRLTNSNIKIYEATEDKDKYYLKIKN